MDGLGVPGKAYFFKHMLGTRLKHSFVPLFFLTKENDGLNWILLDELGILLLRQYYYYGLIELDLIDGLNWILLMD